MDLPQLLQEAKLTAVAQTRVVVDANEETALAAAQNVHQTPLVRVERLAEPSVIAFGTYTDLPNALGTGETGDRSEEIAFAGVVEHPYAAEREPRADRVELMSVEPHRPVDRLALLEVKVVRQEPPSTNYRLHRTLTDSSPILGGQYQKVALANAARAAARTPVGGRSEDERLSLEQRYVDLPSIGSPHDQGATAGWQFTVPVVNGQFRPVEENRSNVQTSRQGHRQGVSPVLDSFAALENGAQRRTNPTAPSRRLHSLRYSLLPPSTEFSNLLRCERKGWRLHLRVDSRSGVTSDLQAGREIQRLILSRRWRCFRLGDVRLASGGTDTHEKVNDDHLVIGGARRKDSQGSRQELTPLPIWRLRPLATAYPIRREH